MEPEMNTPEQGAIYGVELENLPIIPAGGGPVLKMIWPQGSLAPLPRGCCGEIYFSVLEPGALKAWKRHHRQTQFLAVPYGRIKFVLFDDREDSPTRNAIWEIILGRPDDYRLLKIPPGVYYGFANLSRETEALVCNCADIPHDPAEGEKLPWDTTLVPYQWTL